MEQIFLGLILIFAAAMPPVVEPGTAPKDTRYPHRVECAMNLMHTGKVLRTYLLARGAMPTKLSDAHAADVASAGYLHLSCPGERESKWAGEGFTVSYSYFNVATDKIKSGDIIAFDSEPRHEGGRNALLSDLETVAFFEEAEFQKILAAQKARHDSEGVAYNIVADDFMLVPEGERVLSAWQRMLASTHFKIVLALSGAIVLVGAMMFFLRRKNRQKDNS